VSDEGGATCTLKETSQVLSHFIFGAEVNVMSSTLAIAGYKIHTGMQSS
jgi:hypothetical protein